MTSLAIPHPPPDEQRAIARVLGTIQRAIEATERVIAAARQLKRSLLRYLFTYGPVPLAEAARVPLKETEIGPVPQHWEVVPLGSVAEHIWYGTSKRAEVGIRGVPVLGIPNVIGGRIDARNTRNAPLTDAEAGRLRLRPGDLLFVRTNATRENLGRCAVYDGHPPGAAFASYLIGVRLDRRLAIPPYVHLFTATPEGRSYLSGRASGAADGKFNINTQTIKSVTLPLPPLDEQGQIERSVGAVDRKIEMEERRRAALKALFRTMLHLLMTGQVRAKALS